MRALPLLLLLAAPAVAQDKLAGTYAVKEFHREGKAVADEVKKSVSAVKIANGTLTITMGGKEIVAKVKTDDRKKPAEIDLFPQNDPFEKERAFKGIFELKDGTLTITYVEDGDRPKDFTTEAKTSTKLVLEKK